MKIEVGKTYETRNGCLVRVVYIGAESDYPVVGLINIYGTEEAGTWGLDGCVYSEGEEATDLVREHVPLTYRWYRVFDNTAVGHPASSPWPYMELQKGLIKLAFDPSGNLVIDKCEITGAQPNG